mgnify:CR=1 FL=1
MEIANEDRIHFDQAVHKLKEIKFYRYAIKCVADCDCRISNYISPGIISRKESVSGVTKVQEYRYSDTISMVEEIAFVFSGFLNACYSCLEYLKQDCRLRDLVKGFMAKHKQFYGSGSGGGFRTRTVHFGLVKPEFYGYAAPTNHKEIDKVVKRLRRLGIAKKVPPEEVATLPPPRPDYYLDNSSPQGPISEVCMEHENEIRKLIGQCREILGLKKPAPNGRKVMETRPLPSTQESGVGHEITMF